MNPAGGDDFELSFRVDASNLFANGHFDCGLDSWTLMSTNPDEIDYSVDDFEDSNESASAVITNLTASTTSAWGSAST